MNNDWIENERKLFEADAVKHGFDVQSSKRKHAESMDDYANGSTGYRWSGWLAAKQAMVNRPGF